MKCTFRPVPLSFVVHACAYDFALRMRGWKNGQIYLLQSPCFTFTVTCYLKSDQCIFWQKRQLTIKVSELGYLRFVSLCKPSKLPDSHGVILNVQYC